MHINLTWITISHLQLQEPQDAPFKYLQIKMICSPTEKTAKIISLLSQRLEYAQEISKHSSP